MIHVAIVGTGSISHMHVAGLLTFPKRCRIVALCDIYPEKAEAMKKKYKLDCEVFAEHRAMLASDIRIDLVHVCTPPYVHCEIAVDSMDAGCNVLVEKPMAACLAECDEMLEAERRNQVTLACIAQNRFRNSIYHLKKWWKAAWQEKSAWPRWSLPGGGGIAIMISGGGEPGRKREVVLP